MKATLRIDENKIGDVNVGMIAEISVDTYPYKQPWKGPIDVIGMNKMGAAVGAVASQAQQMQGEAVVYKAEVLIDNAEGLLRPGMTVHAKVLVAEAKQVLAVPGFIFQLNSKVLKNIAQIRGYAFKQIKPEKKKKILEKIGKNPRRVVWIFKDNMICEKIVEIGITDNAYFEIVSEVKEDTDIIVDDMTASDELKRIAKQIAGS